MRINLSVSSIVHLRMRNMATKAQLQHENDELRQRVAQLEKQLAVCREETDAERLHNLFEHIILVWRLSVRIIHQLQPKPY